MTQSYVPMKCNCKVHANGTALPPTKAEVTGIMVNGLRHFRHPCGCNVIGNTLFQFCPKDTFK